jgi:hypothetical protein
MCRDFHKGGDLAGADVRILTEIPRRRIILLSRSRGSEGRAGDHTTLPRVCNGIRIAGRCRTQPFPESTRANEEIVRENEHPSVASEERCP